MEVNINKSIKIYLKIKIKTKKQENKFCLFYHHDNMKFLRLLN